MPTNTGGADSDREEECTGTAQQQRLVIGQPTTWFSSSMPILGGVMTINGDLTRNMTLTPPPTSEGAACNGKLEGATICSSSSATVEMVESESESSSSSLCVAHGDVSADEHELVVSGSYYEDDDDFGQMELRGLDAFDKAALSPFYEDEVEECSSTEEQEDESLTGSEETEYSSPHHGFRHRQDCNATPATATTSGSESSRPSPASFFARSVATELFRGPRTQAADESGWMQDSELQSRLKLPKGTSRLHDHQTTTFSKVLHWLNEMYFVTMAFVLASFHGKNSMEKVFRIFLSLVLCALLLNVAILQGHHHRHGSSGSVGNTQLPQAKVPSSNGGDDGSGRLLTKTQKESILRYIRQPSLSPLWDPAASQNDDGFAVRVMAATSKTRPELLGMSLQSLESCPSVRSVEVEFSDKDFPSGSDDLLSSLPPSTSVRRVSDETLSEAMSSSDAVLLLSDDIVFSCEELQRAHSLWLKNPKRMVGFFPYRHEKLGAGTNRASIWNHLGMPSHQPRAVMTHLPGEDGPYHLLSDRAVFVHKAYLSSRPLIRALQSIAQEHEPCRSLALSLAVTSTSTEAPLAVTGSPLELRSSTLSRHARRDEEERRLDRVSGCFDLIMSGFGLEDLPEETSTYIGGAIS